MLDKLLMFLKVRRLMLIPPNYWDSGERLSKEKLKVLLELIVEMGSTRKFTRDPVVLALIKKTKRKHVLIGEMARRGEITLQQTVDDWLELYRENHALMTILSGGDNR